MIRYSKENPGKEVQDEKESIQPDALGRGGAVGRRAGAPAGHEPLGVGEPHPVRVRLRPHAGAAHQRYFRGHRGARFPLARAGAVFRAELAVHVAQIEPRLQVPSDGQV